MITVQAFTPAMAYPRTTTAAKQPVVLPQHPPAIPHEEDEFVSTTSQARSGAKNPLFPAVLSTLVAVVPMTEGMVAKAQTPITSSLERWQEALGNALACVSVTEKKGKKNIENILLVGMDTTGNGPVRLATKAADKAGQAIKQCQDLVAKFQQQGNAHSIPHSGPSTFYLDVKPMENKKVTLVAGDTVPPNSSDSFVTFYRDGNLNLGFVTGTTSK